MKIRALASLLLLLALNLHAQTKKLNLSPAPPTSAPKPLDQALSRPQDEQPSLLCVVGGKNYLATTEDTGKCTAMGGVIKEGVDNNAGNIKYVPVMAPPKRDAFDQPRPNAQDKSDPMRPDN